MAQNKKGSAMVVGGGIAGMQAALDLADSGFYVYLVERSSSIGGIMSQLDKTFPTNDCAMWIISPKLVEVGRHINIELHTCSSVEKIEGENGNFSITLHKTPRYIDPDKCTACGDCTEVCPVELPSEYDEGLGSRKAIYKKYAQAIPGGFAIQKADKAPCRLACPAGLNVQGYVQMVGQEKYKEALEIIMEDLPLPGVLGRICPHGCEDACRRCEVDDPVAIRDLKRLAADQFDPRNIEIKCLPTREEKVAIIGSGPAGLSAAYQLARKGILSTIFEALPEAGGMLRVGIPAHRLPREVLDKDIEVVTNLGVEIKTNTPLGPELTVGDLFSQGYKAVYLAIGAHVGIELGVPGEKADGVRQGVDLLREVNLSGKAHVGESVGIIGGGNVAIDVARCAVRLGAKEVSIIYRRSRAEMPAWEEEIRAAEDEGVKITYLSAPQEVLIEDDKVVGLRCIRMELTEPDSSGRRKPVPIPGSEYDINIDQLIPAIGQRSDLSAIKNIASLEFSKWGTTEVDAITYATGREGVFAGGDVQTGPWVAIGAIAAGKEAAESIVRYIDGQDILEGREPIVRDDPVYRPIPNDEPRAARAKMPELSLKQRKGNFKEVELGYTEADGQAEANRCLNCSFCCECFQCVNVCKAEAVSIETHAEKKETVSINAGAVLIAPGAAVYDPAVHDTYGYKQSPNIVTSLEFERILAATGPFAGHLVRPSDHKEPEKIAWIQCVGSRDEHPGSQPYCSGVCCTYAIKEAIIAKEHQRGALDAAIFYIDIRTHGKDFERYYNRAQEADVRFLKSKISTIRPAGDTGNLIIGYTDETGRRIDEEFDMVVLSVGFAKSEEALNLAQKLDIELDKYQLALTSSFEPVRTSKPGIFVCGTFESPKDIPQSVIEASASAAMAESSLSESRWSLTQTKETVEEIDVRGEHPRIGVFVCRCGTNIAGFLEVPEVVEYAKTLPDVVFVEDNLFSCSQDTQERMTQIIKEQKLNRVVVASCTPRTHEPLFQETVLNAGINKYLFEMANIRNQCSWVHSNDNEAATQKAKDLVRMAVSKVGLLAPLSDPEIAMTQSALVVGGGLSGITAAKNLAQQGYLTYLVEKSDTLGGQALSLYETWQGEDVQKNLTVLINDIETEKNINILKNALIKEVTGFVGNFQTTVETAGKEQVIDHGIAIIATGAEEFKPDQYLYGEDPRVLTGMELDRKFIDNDLSLNEINSAVFIQCVGSRIEERPYCSKVCCTQSVKNALKLKELKPEMDVFILYRDMRTYGLREGLYREARDKGVVFVRYDFDKELTVSKDNDDLNVRCTSYVLQREVEIKPDMLVLATAIVPPQENSMAQLFKVPLNDDGFFVEAHAKLQPIDFSTKGVFVCGLAHSPKPVDEAIAQSLGAASRASVLLSRENITVEGVVSHVQEDLCRGCGECEQACPYNAIAVEEREGSTKVAYVQEALCKGCGACSVACPTGAASVFHYEDQEVLTMVEAALEI